VQNGSHFEVARLRVKLPLKNVKNAFQCTCPKHDPLLVVTNRRKDRIRSVKRSMQKTILDSGGVLEFIQEDE
jgi:hypothetical protein